MGRHAKPVKSRSLHVMLEGPDYDRLESFLFSEIEGRVPHGEYQKFFTKTIRDFFARLDSQPAVDPQPAPAALLADDLLKELT